MRNEQAVVIRKAMTAIGAGLLEDALEAEGRKGCSPILCSEPVPLEPSYVRFDSSLVLRQNSVQKQIELRSDGRRPRVEELVTFHVYPAEEDLLTIGWMETGATSVS